MDLKRFFSFDGITDGGFTVSGGEFRHAVKVSRLKVGHKLIINDNTAFDYYCTVEKIAKDSFTARIDSIEPNDTGGSGITLYVGMCRELDDVIQKAVEMGVERLVPFTSQHTNPQPFNQERLHKIIVESSKQCGRPSLMLLELPLTISRAFVDAENNAQNLFFYEHERRGTPKDSIAADASSTGVFIGSEGGFSADEVKEAKNRGYKVLTLGKRILRVQTAVVAALALCLQELDKL